jgi:hypothetical protein
VRPLKAVMLLAAVAMCVLGATSAFANLPEYGMTLPNSFNTASTSPEFEASGGSVKLKCAKSEGKGTIGSPQKTLTLDELYLTCECFILGIKAGVATGLTDTVSGSILAKGTTTLGFKLGTLLPVVPITVSEFHFECGTSGALSIVKGCFAGPTTLAKSSTMTWTFSGSAGKQELTDYTSDAGATVACKLESNTNGGGFKESDQKQTTILSWSKEVEVKD